MRLAWDDVYWENTHIDGIASDFDDNQIHIGTWEDQNRARYLVIRVGSDDDEKPHGTAIFDLDSSLRVILDLDMSRRSL